MITQSGELIARLITTLAGLDLRAERAHDEYKAYHADRAEQCRKWLFDLRYGGPVDAGRIAGGFVLCEGRKRHPD